MAGIYLHIPFCKQACYYCDFHFSTNHELKGALVDSICKEIRDRQSYLDEKIETIYFGGGTPSLLGKHELMQILNQINSSFDIVDAAEVTLEANPDDLGESLLLDLKSVGVNRLSIGIQSFSNDILQSLHRVHDAQMAIEAYEQARRAGFDNINVDLIYAIPGESIDMLEKDLDIIIDLDPEHVSCYALTIEEKTVFGKWAKSGKFTPVDDEIGAEHFEKVMNSLMKAGFDHYEISNFSKVNYHSRHNSSYWQGKSYLGVGPSAHSYNRITRRHNVSNNSVYIMSINSDQTYFEEETLTLENKINEYLLTYLRTKWGCDSNYLLKELNYDILVEHNQYLSKLQLDQYISIDKGIIKLTQRGKLLADQIVADLVLLNTNQDDYSN